MNDVIGMARRGDRAKMVFDFDDPMGDSTCVACGECVQACPTGALMPSALVHDGVRTAWPDRTVDSLCPYCGVGCQVTYHVEGERILYADGRDGPANHNRLCVKGRFGFDYIHHPHRLTVPLVRRDGVSEACRRRASIPRTRGRISARRHGTRRSIAPPRGFYESANGRGRRRSRDSGARKGRTRRPICFQKLVRTGLRFQQRRSLHAAVPRLVGGGTDGGAELGCGDGAVRGRARCRSDLRHRREPDRQSSRRRHVHQERRAARRETDRRRSARTGVVAPGHLRFALPPRHGRRAAERDAAHDHRRGTVRHPIRAGEHRRLRRACGKGARVSCRPHVRSLRHSRRGNPCRSAYVRDVRRRRSSSGAWASASTSMAPTTPVA